MNKKSSKQYPNPDILESSCNVVSSCDCTGLIQSAPTIEDEVEEYADIYDIPSQPMVEELSENLEKGKDKLK